MSKRVTSERKKKYKKGPEEEEVHTAISDESEVKETLKKVLNRPIVGSKAYSKKFGDGVVVSVINSTNIECNFGGALRTVSIDELDTVGAL